MTIVVVVVVVVDIDVDDDDDDDDDDIILRLFTRMYSSRMRTVRYSNRGECLPARGGVCLPGGSTQGGVCPRRGGGGWAYTDTCENITFPQLLLRTVIIFLPVIVIKHCCERKRQENVMLCFSIVVSK